MLISFQADANDCGGEVGLLLLNYVVEVCVWRERARGRERGFYQEDDPINSETKAVIVEDNANASCDEILELLTHPPPSKLLRYATGTYTTR